MSPSDERGRQTEEGSSNGSSGGLADWGSALRDVTPYLDLGWRLAGAAALPPLLGHFVVDRLWDTTPWGLLGGAVVGFATVIVQLWRLQEGFDR